MGRLENHCDRLTRKRWQPTQPMQSAAKCQNIKVYAFKWLFVPFSEVTLTVCQGEYRAYRERGGG